MRHALGAAIVSIAALAGLAPTGVLAAEPTFGEASASAALGEPLVLTAQISGDDIASVEALVRLAGEPTAIVLETQPGTAAGEWQATHEIDITTSALCACLADGQSPPNARFEYQFRVRAVDGTSTLGPLGEGIVSDERFEWRTLADDQVRVHWYAGDEAFGQSAATVANQAIDRASALLGTTLAEPVDLFVYDTEEALRSAVSPNRENVAGQAHAAIQTMFVHIPAGESASGFAGTLVAHELTHLVFDAATDNLYQHGPRWLDEGVAVYLSEGYNSFWSSYVDRAVTDRTLIPLDGLRGLFPSSSDEFFLAYAESVAAIDFFIRTHGEETLWELVRSYARGLSDDAAFTEATGADLDAFNAAWFASLDLEVPAPLGPQPGPPGIEPDDWQDGAPATPGPSVAPASPGEPQGTTTPTTGPIATSAPPTRGPDAPPATDTSLTAGLVLVGWLIIAGVLIGLVLIVLRRRDRAPRPPQG